MRRRVDPDDVDRMALLLADTGEAPTFEAAAALLRTYRFQVVAGSGACRAPAWQAALLTAVNAGVRAMHGGVRVVLAEDQVCELSSARGIPLSDALRRHGAEIVSAVDPGVPTIAMGAEVKGTAVVHVFAGRWVAGVSPVPVVESGAASVPAATLAAAIAVGECFQRLRGFAPAADRAAVVSLWNPEAACEEGPELHELPDGVWLLGLGHLGQAYAWLLSLLPYPAASRRRLVLQDDDILTKANRATSMLHAKGRLGRRKARIVAAAMEPLGWQTTVVERRFDGERLYRPGDPAVLLGGVDNPRARHLLDDTGFPVVIDAGLGRGPDGFLAMTVRRLPAGRPSRRIWPAEAPPGSATATAPAYAALERETGDRCGVEQLAGRTIATAFVGVVAACWAIGGLLRELHGGRRYELIDLTLRNPGEVTAIPASDQRAARVPTVPCS